jgi:hypothetical protein
VVSKIKKIEAENQELRNLLNLSKHTEVEMTRKLGTYRYVTLTFSCIGVNMRPPCSVVRP